MKCESAWKISYKMCININSENHVDKWVIFHTDIRYAKASAGKFVLISCFYHLFFGYSQLFLVCCVRCEEFDSLTIFKDQRST